MDSNYTKHRALGASRGVTNKEGSGTIEKIAKNYDVRTIIIYVLPPYR